MDLIFTDSKGLFLEVSLHFQRSSNHVVCFPPQNKLQSPRPCPKQHIVTPSTSTYSKMLKKTGASIYIYIHSSRSDSFHLKEERQEVSNSKPLVHGFGIALAAIECCLLRHLLAPKLSIESKRKPTGCLSFCLFLTKCYC